MSAHNQNPKARAAKLTLSLRADSGYTADTEYRISAEQWGEILRICEGNAEKMTPVFWYRPRSDGLGYDGPLHDGQIEPVRRESGAWVPLYAIPMQPPKHED